MAMKKIDFKSLNERNDYQIGKMIGGIEMEFIKYGKNYIIKNSGGKVVSEKERLQLEKEELILQDITSNNCQEKTTKKIKKITKKIEEKEKPNANTIEEADRTV